MKRDLEKVLNEYRKQTDQLEKLISLKNEEELIYIQKYNKFIKKNNARRKIINTGIVISGCLLMFNIFNIIISSLCELELGSIIINLFFASLPISLTSAIAYKLFDYNKAKIKFCEENRKSVDNLEKKIAVLKNNVITLFNEFDLIYSKSSKTDAEEAYKKVYSYRESDNEIIEDDSLKNNGPVKSIGKLKR